MEHLQAVAARRVAMFDLARQNAALGALLDRRLTAVLEHGRFVLGPEVEEIETALARYAEVRYAIGVSSGRDALLMTLMALRIGAGDGVFVPALTFSATAGAVVGAGAVPLFVDIDPQTCNMSPAALEQAVDRALRQGTPRPKAIMPVDLYGLPADYRSIQAVADYYGLAVVADAAQSFGASYGGRRAGGLARATATSFYPTKPLGAFGDAGAVLTDDAEIAEAVRSIRNHGMRGSGCVAEQIGMTGRMDTVQAAVLLAKLDVFDARLEACARLADRYTRALGGRVTTPTVPHGSASAWALYTIRTKRRDALRQRLADAEIDTGIYYPVPLHRHPAFRRYVTGAEKLPVSEQVADEALSLPLHPGLRDADIDYVSATIAEFVS